jgi:hypothetical protein
VLLHNQVTHNITLAITEVMAKQLSVKQIISEGNKAESGETAQLELSAFCNSWAVEADPGVNAAQH